MYEFSLPSAARARYDEMLREAEQERLALRVRAQEPNWHKQILWHLSQSLITTGNWLKTYSEMRPSAG